MGTWIETYLNRLASRLIFILKNAGNLFFMEMVSIKANLSAKLYIRSGNFLLGFSGHEWLLIGNGYLRNQVMYGE